MQHKTALSAAISTSILLGMLLLVSSAFSSGRAQGLPTPTPDPGQPGTNQGAGANQAEATPIPTPTPRLTPPPTSVAPGCEEPFPLETGSFVKVRAGVNIRTAASVSAPQVEYLEEQRDFVVTGGPVCSDNYIWWAVRRTGLSGWVAQGSTVLDFITGFEAAAPACNEPLDLTLNEPIELVRNVRVRLEPDLDARVITVAPAGNEALILSAPECNDGYNWRRVRVEVVNVVYEGWMAEADRANPDKTFVLQEGPECYPPLDFSEGDRVRVFYRSGPPKNLRSNPGTNADVLYTLVSGVPLEITGKSVCSGGLNWWPVRVLGTIPTSGWIAEGGRPNPALLPFDEPSLPLPGR